MNFSKVFMTCIACMLLTLPTSHAGMRFELPREPDGIEVLLGIGGGYDDSAYKGEESFTGFSPVIALFTKHIYLDIHEISYRFSVMEDVTLKLYGLQDDLPNAEDLPPFLNTKSGESFDVGLNGKKMFADTYVEAGFDADVTGTHNGYRIHLSAGYLKRAGAQGLGVEIGAKYQDRKRSNYYYGVSPEEASDELPAHTANEDISFYFDANYIYALTKNIGVHVGATAGSINNSRKKSPRINDNAKLSAIEAYVSLIWQFSVYGFDN